MHKKIIAISLAVITILSGCSANPEEKQVQVSEHEQQSSVNVYSARNYDVDKDMFLRFEEETGIKVNLIEGKGDELLERMNREKNNPQADLFLTVGGETISYVKEQGLLQSHEIENVDTIVEEGLYGEDWIALTKRARVLIYDKNENPDSKIQSYFDLGQEVYSKKLLVRSGTSSYNIALTANIIQNYGSEKAREFVGGVVKNMAREPQGNDRDQAKGVIAGDGDYAIMNTYYVLKMLNSADPAEINVGKQVGVVFPEETHVNISWGGIIKDAKNKENAKKLIEYLLDEEKQKIYMEENGEYPVNINIELNELLKGFGDFKQMPINYEELGNYTTEAVMMLDELGWK
jgi:iron(III) transport system substrate-binding protein